MGASIYQLVFFFLACLQALADDGAHEALQLHGPLSSLYRTESIGFKDDKVSGFQRKTLLSKFDIGITGFVSSGSIDPPTYPPSTSTGKNYQHLSTSSTSISQASYSRLMVGSQNQREPYHRHHYYPSPHSVRSASILNRSNRTNLRQPPPKTLLPPKPSIQHLAPSRHHSSPPHRRKRQKVPAAPSHLPSYRKPLLPPSLPPPSVPSRRHFVPPPPPPKIPPQGHIVRHPHLTPRIPKVHPAPPPASPPHHPLPPYNLPSLPTPSSSPPSFPSPSPIAPSPPFKPDDADCSSLVCQPPLAKTPLMTPCECVPSIQVEIELSMPLYSLFPLISILAVSVADCIALSPKQVQVMGANADNQNPDYSVVDLSLVPFGQQFDNITALLIYQKFWNRDLSLNATLFGNYSVVYIRYPGLPPSPPSGNFIGLHRGIKGNSTQNPLGVDVKEERHHKYTIGIIVLIALSSFIVLLVCFGVFYLVLFKSSHHKVRTTFIEVGPVRMKKSARYSLSSDHGSSASMSYVSSIATYTGTAKTFAYAELERATDRFRSENIIGEGGFGRVYKGILDDGRKVAVKMLTRDDHQGGKEFIAEVETLSRLHHRNLVKLIGICVEEHNRCLVYELIPNGSVESHLHGVDKEASPLDWGARLKIALGAARGLAYLHEDSNPRIIHRDFKASNILLENDFNPKVSDFGLAKAAPDEGNEHLSTRVMGTFGYVAPEYAMTGHLLVKSDVYSYGVVLLELLSGRKPVDMTQAPGQENLVTWARPLLTSKEGLDILVDPALENNYSTDSFAKVAAIASMCVQPEVSNRPFMGEVVQALKLVCNESELHAGTPSSNFSQGGDSYVDVAHSWLSRRSQFMVDSSSFISIDYDSGPTQAGETLPCSEGHIFSNSSSFRRHSFSGPLTPTSTRNLNKQDIISECTLHSTRQCATD